MSWAAGKGKSRDYAAGLSEAERKVSTVVVVLALCVLFVRGKLERLSCDPPSRIPGVQQMMELGEQVNEIQSYHNSKGTLNLNHLTPQLWNTWAKAALDNPYVELMVRYSGLFRIPACPLCVLSLWVGSSCWCSCLLLRA